MDFLMLPMGEIGLNHILLGFAGGIMGACFAALPIFAMCGIFIIIGVALSFTGAGGPVFDTIAFGSVFGPHVAFGGGVAAAAYASHKKYMATGRDIISALGGFNRPDVLLVGGVFGSLGVVLAWIFQTLIPFAWNGFHWTDSVGLSVLVSALIARLMFSKTGLFGKVPEGEKQFKPLLEKTWLPWQSTSGQLFVYGLGFGILAAYLCRVLTPAHGGVVIGFGISAVSLFLLQTGFKIPVTHHITLIAAGATAASGGSIIWGTVFGILASYFAEFVSRLFLIYSDTHIDPSATTICFMWCVLVACGAIGLYTCIPLP